MFSARETEPTLKEYDFWSYIINLFMSIGDEGEVV